MLKRVIIQKRDGYTNVRVIRYLEGDRVISRTYIPSFQSCNRINALIERDSDYRAKHELKTGTLVWIYPNNIELSFMFACPRVETQEKPIDNLPVVAAGMFESLRGWCDLWDTIEEWIQNTPDEHERGRKLYNWSLKDRKEYMRLQFGNVVDNDPAYKNIQD